MRYDKQELHSREGGRNESYKFLLWGNIFLIGPFDAAKNKYSIPVSVIQKTKEGPLDHKQRQDSKRCSIARPCGGCISWRSQNYWGGSDTRVTKGMIYPQQKRYSFRGSIVHSCRKFDTLCVSGKVVNIQYELAKRGIFSHRRNIKSLWSQKADMMGEDSLYYS